MVLMARRLMATAQQRRLERHIARHRAGRRAQLTWDQSGAAEAAHDATKTPRPPKTREGTKQTTLIAMLREEGGATIAEIVAATGWQSHPVRGAMSVALKKKLGLVVTSERDETRGRVYRLPAA